MRDVQRRDETWTYDPAEDAWAQLAPDPHPATRFSQLVYDSESDRVILVGQSALAQRMETWAYDTNTDTWEDVTTEPAPRLTLFPSMAYDSGSDRVVFVGRAGEVWTYDYNANIWAPVEVPSSVTLGSINGRAVYDPTRGIVVFHGGQKIGAVGDDRVFTTWGYEHDSDTWVSWHRTRPGRAAITAWSSTSQAGRSSSSAAGNRTLRATQTNTPTNSGSSR